MQKKKRYRLRVIPLLILITIVCALVYAGVWFYNAVSIQYPNSMTHVDSSGKQYGKQKTHKEKTESYFIVQHYPSTGDKALDEWILTTTDSIREKLKTDVLNKAIVGKDEKPHELLQDYSSSLIDNNYSSVILTTYLDQEVYDIRARVYDKSTSTFTTVQAFFKPGALRLLTNEARQATDMGTLNRFDYLKSVNLMNGLESFFINGSEFTFVFDHGMKYTRDIKANPDYLAIDLGSVKKTYAVLPSAYVSQGVDPSEKLVALTFDDGPHGEFTKQVMDLLDKYDVHATFFVLGSRIEGREDILKEILDRGHQLASHSWNHPDLTQLNQNDAIAQISNTETALINATGYKGPYYVRPPYGSISPTLRKTIDRVFINWTVDSEDWLSKNPETICKKIDHDAFDGSIVLMHDIHETTLQSLECTLQTLKNEGYTFVTVQELLEARGVNPTPGELYRKGARQQ